MTMQDRFALVLSACTLVALWLGWLKILRPRIRKLWQRVDGALDTLGGRPPIVDNESGRELAPALPPLGERLATMEDALVRLADDRVRLDALEHRVTALETAAVERIAIRAESAQMLRAVAERDTDVVDSDPTTDLLPPEP